MDWAVEGQGRQRQQDGGAAGLISGRHIRIPSLPLRLFVRGVETRFSHKVPFLSGCVIICLECFIFKQICSCYWLNGDKTCFYLSKNSSHFIADAIIPLCWRSWGGSRLNNSSFEQIWASMPALEPTTAKNDGVDKWTRWLMQHLTNETSNPVKYHLLPFLKQ